MSARGGNSPARRGIRFGIGTKLYLAIAGAVAFTLTASLIAWHGFVAIADRVSEITTHHVPATTRSLQLGLHTNAIAALAPVLLAAVEKVAFDTHLVASLLLYRMSGGDEGAKYSTDAGMVHSIEHLSPVSFLFSPGLWIGFAFAGAFLYGAIRLRRNREPS